MSEPSQTPAYSKDQNFCIIGAGRVGVSLGVLLLAQGHRIVGCTARTSGSLEKAVGYLGCPGFTDPQEAVSGADCVLISVPDGAVPEVARRLSGKVPQGTIAFHTAGSIGRNVLHPLAEGGVLTAAIHMLQSVPDVERGIQRIPGSFFGITAAPQIEGWANDFVAALGGIPFAVGEGERNLYHAAAVITSNYLTTLASLGGEIAGDLKPYLPLMRGTLDNLNELEVGAALTGPVARGDHGTVRRHLAELRERFPEVARAYESMARVTLEAAERAGRLQQDDAKRIREILDDAS